MGVFAGFRGIMGLDALSHGEVLFRFRQVPQSKITSGAVIPATDLKPVMKEFLPRQGIFQPAWALELMTHMGRPVPERRKKASAEDYFCLFST